MTWLDGDPGPGRERIQPILLDEFHSLSGHDRMVLFHPGGTGEVSFTEWAVQYWPVKLTIPIGAALMVLQGISKLIKDIMILTSGRT